MTHNALHHPSTDPTPIFEYFRGSCGSELLTAAVAHFNLFGQLNQQSLTFEDLRAAIGLESRPAHVLITALRAMGLIEESDGVLALTELAKEHLVPGGEFDVGGYVGLAAQSPGVLGMVECLKSNKPFVGDDGGTAFIYSAAEYQSWIRDTELVTIHQTSTGVHCGVIVAMRQNPNPPY